MEVGEVLDENDNAVEQDAFPCDDLAYVVAEVDRAYQDAHALFDVHTSLTDAVGDDVALGLTYPPYLQDDAYDAAQAAMTSAGDRDLDRDSHLASSFRLEVQRQRYFHYLVDS